MNENDEYRGAVMTAVIDPEPSSPEGSILDYIKQNSGTDQEEIAQALCIKMDHTRHYLDKLRKDGAINIIRQGSLKRYYPVEPIPGEPEICHEEAISLVNSGMSEPPPESGSELIRKTYEEGQKALDSMKDMPLPKLQEIRVIATDRCEPFSGEDYLTLERGSITTSTAPANREWLLSELTRLSDEAGKRGLRVKATVEWPTLRADVVIEEARG